MHHHFSLFAKKTASCDQSKTTERSMPSPFETNIPFPSSRTSFVTSATCIYIQSLTSDGDTTMCASVKETNEKRHLKPDMDFSNPRSCTSDSPIHQQRSKP